MTLQNHPSLAEWEGSVGLGISGDPLWSVQAYRISLYAIDCHSFDRRSMPGLSSAASINSRGDRVVQYAQGRVGLDHRRAASHADSDPATSPHHTSPFPLEGSVADAARFRTRRLIPAVPASRIALSRFPHSDPASRIGSKLRIPHPSPHSSLSELPKAAVFPYLRIAFAIVESCIFDVPS